MPSEIKRFNSSIRFMGVYKLGLLSRILLHGSLLMPTYGIPTLNSILNYKQNPSLQYKILNKLYVSFRDLVYFNLLVDIGSLLLTSGPTCLTSS